MTLELMRETTDCEVAAIANACGVTYEQAKAVLNLPAKNKERKTRRRANRSGNHKYHRQKH